MHFWRVLVFCVVAVVGAIAQPRVHGSWEEAFLPALPTDGAATDGEATKLSE